MIDTPNCLAQKLSAKLAYHQSPRVVEAINWLAQNILLFDVTPVLPELPYDLRNHEFQALRFINRLFALATKVDHQSREHLIGIACEAESPLCSFLWKSDPSDILQFNLFLVSSPLDIRSQFIIRIQETAKAKAIPFVKIARFLALTHQCSRLQQDTIINQCNPEQFSQVIAALCRMPFRNYPLIVETALRIQPYYPDLAVSLSMMSYFLDGSEGDFYQRILNYLAPFKGSHLSIAFLEILSAYEPASRQKLWNLAVLFLQSCTSTLIFQRCIKEAFLLPEEALHFISKAAITNPYSVVCYLRNLGTAMLESRLSLILSLSEACRIAVDPLCHFFSLLPHNSRFYVNFSIPIDECNLISINALIAQICEKAHREICLQAAVTKFFQMGADPTTFELIIHDLKSLLEEPDAISHYLYGFEKLDRGIRHDRQAMAALILFCSEGNCAGYPLDKFLHYYEIDSADDCKELSAVLQPFFPTENSYLVLFALRKIPKDRRIIVGKKLALYTSSLTDFIGILEVASTLSLENYAALIELLSKKRPRGISSETIVKIIAHLKFFDEHFVPLIISSFRDANLLIYFSFYWPRVGIERARRAYEAALAISNFLDANSAQYRTARNTLLVLNANDEETEERLNACSTKEELITILTQRLENYSSSQADARVFVVSIEHLLLSYKQILMPMAEPLENLALHVKYIASNRREANPWERFRKQARIDISRIETPQCELYGKKISVRAAAFREAAEVYLPTITQLPPSIDENSWQQLCAPFLSQEEQMQERFDKGPGRTWYEIKKPMVNPAIHNLLKFDRRQPSPLQLQFACNLAYLQTQDDEKVLEFAQYIQECRAGQQEGIALYYNRIPLKFKYVQIETNETLPEIVEANIFLARVGQVFLERTFNDPEFLKELCDTEEEVHQEVHHILHAKNELAAAVGYRHEKSFDLYLPLVSKRLLERRAEEIATIFFKHARAERLIELFRNELSACEDPALMAAKMFNISDQGWDYEDFSISPEGALALLIKAGYFIEDHTIYQK